MDSFTISCHGNDRWTVQNQYGDFWCGEKEGWKEEEKILNSFATEEIFSLSDLKDFIKERFSVDLDK